jgi:outer membrane receptor protein involved in Fe transport
MNSRFTKTFFCIALFVFTALRAFSQAGDTSKFDNLSLKDLLNIKITTANKTSQALELASAAVTVITKEQIRLRGYQSLLDVMYDLQDVKVDDKMYSGIRNSFTIRGMQGSEKFIILLDGINISSPSGEAMPVMQNYPVHLAEQIEILYGPASALYGANAVSGIINIVTKKIPEKDIMIDASSAAGDYRSTNTTLFISKKLGAHTSLVISGQYYYDRNPDYSKLYKDDTLSSVASYAAGTFNTIYGPFTPSVAVTPKYEAPMEAYNLFAALHTGDFSFSFFKNYSKTPTALGNNTLNSIFNKDVYMAQTVTTANASYKKVFNKITSTTALTTSEYTLNPKSNYRNLYTAMEPAYKYSLCSMVKAEEQLDYKASENLTITSGAGYENYYSIPQSADLENPVNTGDYIHGSYLGTDSYYKPGGLPAQFYFIRYHNIGSYLQTQYSPVKKINITLGARYDINSRYGSSFNPRAGIVYSPSDQTIIKLLYGSAFLAPSPTDSYSQYGSFDTPDSGRTYHSYFLHLPNPGLKPIKSHNTELNIRQYLTDNAFIILDGYYTVLSGLHAFDDDNNSTRLYHNIFQGIPVDYIEVFVNQQKQETYGGSIQLNLKHSIGNVHFNSYAVFSYVNGVQGDPLTRGQANHHDYQLEFISPVMFRVGSDIKAGKFTCSPRLLIMGRQNLTGLSDTTHYVQKRQTIAGYSLLNISMRYNLSKHSSVFCNVTNALNQRYRNVSFNMDLTKKETELYYGQPQDPIRIMGGFNFNF